MIEFLLGMLFGGISMALIHALLDYANQLKPVVTTASSQSLESSGYI